MPTILELDTFYSASYYDFDKSREEGKGMAFVSRLMLWKPTGKFLDVGCATGFFINGIRRHSNWEVYGTDYGESAVRYAREKLGLTVVQGDLADAAFPDAFFDYVHVNNVLEHVLNPIQLLKECRRIIKPDGVFFLSVPNGFNDSLDLIDFWKEENKPARSKSGHIFFFPVQTLLMLFERIGFALESKKTYSLKRGFRSIGYLPRKSDWKKDYFPRESPEKTTNTEVMIPDQKKKHSDFYYRYRFAQGNLQMIPGLHKFGLDFLFILRPK
jgi:SAM-dependent methyltransferase